MALLSLRVQYATSNPSIPTRAQFRRWINMVLKKQAAAIDASITLRIVDDAEGQLLNQQYRHKNYATNILTFDYEREPLMADLVFCAPIVAKEAREQHKPLLAHYAHLTIHGMLHALGYDHQTAKDAASMENMEIELLAHFRYPNPYTFSPPP